MTRNELKKVIEILTRRCKLICTVDAATNIMTFDEWVDDVLREVNTER